MNPHSFNILDPGAAADHKMISIWYFPQGIRSQALALSLVIVMMTITLTTTVTTFSPPLVKSASADHGQEIVLTSKDTSFAPVSSGEGGGNQVKVVVNYAVHDPMVANDLVKGVMKVYSPDGTLLKTSSSPTPFPITNSHGTATFATTLTDPTIEDVVAKIVFTDPIKTEIVSNELPVSVSLIKDAALTGEPEELEEKPISQVPQESEPKAEDELADESLPEDKLSSTESAIASSEIEEERQSAKIEDVPVIHQSPQMAPTESLPPLQTTANSHISLPPPPPTMLEICNDSIDNDGDTFIDSSDTDCNPLQIQQQQQQQQPTLPQEPVIASSPEICDDNLDNDLDSKIDSSDEECSSIASSMSSVPSPRQAQSVAGEQIEENGDEDKEQESDEDSEESGDEENNNDENEDEDEDEE
jgi:hypothetical protein